MHVQGLLCEAQVLVSADMAVAANIRALPREFHLIATAA
jgi:hypothetical protein